MDAAWVQQVRRFNRTVTQRVGALDDRFLARDRPLGQARLLWEIGAEPETEVRALRARLDLDSGYLARLLRSLRNDGLLDVNPGDDGRVRTVRLTDAGLAERAELDQRADEVAESILRPLAEGQRQRLVEAMAEVERLLVASMVRIEPTDPRHPWARHCIRSYFAELARRFEQGFDPDRSIPASDPELTPPAGLLLVAALHQEPVGCGALKFHADAPAELKRMWVAPGVRGLGLGRRLLTELEAQAAAHGARVVRLETNGALVEAIALYRATGYREVPRFNQEPYADFWFEKTL